MIPSVFFLNSLLFWSKFLIPFAVILFPVWLGIRFGFRMVKKEKDLESAPLGTVVGASLGLLAFMLAFTFEIASSRYDRRKGLLLDDVSAIRSVYLMAGLLKDTNGIPTRNLMKEYVDLRILIDKDQDMIPMVRARSQEIHDSLWAQTEALSREDRSSEIYSLFTSKVYDLIDVHHKRAVVALQYRIPPIVYYELYFIAFVSMLILGLQFGISGKPSLFLNLGFAIMFSSVMWLIYALDKPTAGLLKVDQAALYQLQNDIDKYQMQMIKNETIGKIKPSP